jgi:rRNA maturation endonuclease Nob1
MKPKRWIYVDPWSQKCPVCGDITQYPEEVCDKCGSKVLKNPRKMADG